MSGSQGNTLRLEAALSIRLAVTHFFSHRRQTFNDIWLFNIDLATKPKEMTQQIERQISNINIPGQRSKKPPQSHRPRPIRLPAYIRWRIKSEELDRSVVLPQTANWRQINQPPIRRTP
jgi:hypothetical protein